MTRILFWLVAWITFGSMLWAFGIVLLAYCLFVSGRAYERRIRERELDDQLEAWIAESAEERETIPF